MKVSLIVRLCLGAALSWSAAVGVYGLYERLVIGAAVPWSDRLTLDTEQRLRRAAGPNGDVIDAIGAACTGDVLVVTELISGNPDDYEPEQLMRLALQVGLIDMLRVLKFPRPILVRCKGAIAFAERRSSELGRETAYLWFPGGQRPEPGNGWRLQSAADGFEVWSCRKR